MNIVKKNTNIIVTINVYNKAKICEKSKFFLLPNMVIIEKDYYFIFPL